jgi:hypothetical protein
MHESSLLPNQKLCSFKVKDTLGRLLHFGPENNAYKEKSLLRNFYMGVIFIAAPTS